MNFANKKSISFIMRETRRDERKFMKIESKLRSKSRKCRRIGQPKKPAELVFHFSHIRDSSQEKSLFEGHKIRPGCDT